MTDPVAVPVIAAAVTSCTALTATGMRTLWVPSFQVTAPNWYTSKAAVVRVRVTVNALVSPAPICSVEGHDRREAGIGVTVAL